MNADENAEFGRLLQAFQAARDRGDIKAAESIAAECLSFAADEQEKNPSENLRLLGEAREHENAARWEQAEIAHRQVLALAIAEADHVGTYKAHSDLGSMYTIRGITDRALLEAQSGVEAARKTNIETLLFVALGELSQCQLRIGDIASATATAEEAVRTVPTEKMYDLQRARAFVMRARCRVEQRQTIEAQSDLNIAWQLLEPQAEALMFAGVQSTLANWWEITARTRTESKDFAGAAEAFGKAVDFRRNVSQAPQLDGPHKYFWLASTLQQYSVALQAAGKVDAAISAFDESRRIHQKIGTVIAAR